MNDTLREALIKAKQLQSGEEENPILAQAVALIAKRATRYEDLIDVLREFLRQHDRWVIEHNKEWMVVHKAMSDNHPKKGASLGKTKYFSTEVEAYRFALEQAVSDADPR